MPNFFIFLKMPPPSNLESAAWWGACSPSPPPIMQLTLKKYLNYQKNSISVNKNTKHNTIRLQACGPLSDTVVTPEAVAVSWVDRTVVVQIAIQNVRVRTTLRWNGFGIVSFVTKTACGPTVCCNLL